MPQLSLSSKSTYLFLLLYLVHPELNLHHMLSSITSVEEDCWGWKMCLCHFGGAPRGQRNDARRCRYHRSSWKSDGKSRRNLQKRERKMMWKIKRIAFCNQLETWEMKKDFHPFVIIKWSFAVVNKALAWNDSNTRKKMLNRGWNLCSEKSDLNKID